VRAVSSGSSSIGQPHANSDARRVLISPAISATHPSFLTARIDSLPYEMLEMVGPTSFENNDGGKRGPVLVRQ